jgi:hypothetical protein
MYRPVRPLPRCPSPTVRIDRISVGDIVKASIKGRGVYGEVREVTDGVVHFEPLTRAAGWRHASAHEIVGHWRKTRRELPRAAEEPETSSPREQLSLPGFHG